MNLKWVLNHTHLDPDFTKLKICKGADLHHPPLSHAKLLLEPLKGAGQNK